MALTAKQEAFVNHYCSNGFNGTQAAISAGYSEKTAKTIAGQNLSKLIIKDAIDKFKANITHEAVITALDLVAELEEARALAVEVGQPSAMTSATMGKAKLLGLEKVINEHTGKDGGAIKTDNKWTVEFVNASPES